MGRATKQCSHIFFIPKGNLNGMVTSRQLPTQEQLLPVCRGQRWPVLASPGALGLRSSCLLSLVTDKTC